MAQEMGDKRRIGDGVRPVVHGGERRGVWRCFPLQTGLQRHVAPLCGERDARRQRGGQAGLHGMATLKFVVPSLWTPSFSCCNTVRAEWVVRRCSSYCVHAAGADACFRHAVPPLLSHNTVLQYFAESCFYDLRCNNERVGGRVSELPRLTGVEYVEVAVAQDTPELMAIERRQRSGPTRTETEAAYYVLSGTVYQCPDLHTLLNSRLVRAAWRGVC